MHAAFVTLRPGLSTAERPDSMRALDDLAKNKGADGAPLSAAAVRTQCESGDRDACLTYGLMAVGVSTSGFI